MSVTANSLEASRVSSFGLDLDFVPFWLGMKRFGTK